jgi:hypothetical protein
MTPVFIAAYACSTGASSRFGIIFSVIFAATCGQRPRSEFGVGSKPTGRRLRPQFRGFAAQGWRAGLLGGGV